MWLSKAVFFSLVFVFCGCSPFSEENEPAKLFELAQGTGIDFTNDLTYTEEINPYTFKNFYNGAGVGVGDINNDGLLDVFFCGNMVSNRLYLNKGDWQFEDITEQAGLMTEGVWSTGVSFVDINHDGLLDIYVCKSGPPGGKERHNALYLNQGNNMFAEDAESYGLDNYGLSTHASFFDYDRDGDLDCYLLNNSIRSVGGYDLIENQREIPDTLGGNRLLNNDHGYFRDVSQEAGIYSSDIGFGLGVTISDLNLDGWLDIYVSNDFFERDYLYINQRNGTFRECLTDYMNEISMGSMGADVADINNDGDYDIFVTEMLPERHDRVMSKASFENWDKYRLLVQRGYHHQFSRNALQWNNGDGTFSEVSRLAGVEATDWSWGALIFDMDNDGLNDFFVANGIFKDLLDQDYINFMANPEAIRQMLQNDGEAIKKLIDMIPSEPLPNYAYRNLGGLAFEKVSERWGFGMPTFSNGSAYADLDNDGDLDLLLNNVNMKAHIYENHSDLFGNHFLTVSLQGQEQNPQAIGARVSVYADGKTMVRELNPARGFQSGVDQRLHFGLGNIDKVDSLVVFWPDGTVSSVGERKADQFLIVTYETAARHPPHKDIDTSPVLFQETQQSLIDYSHEENAHVDFDRDRLLFEMASNEGPCACKGDLNSDGLEDIYLGGARGQAGAVFWQREDGTFEKAQTLAEQMESEDTDCVIADFDNDGQNDLMVTSGGSEFTSFSVELRDRIYFGNGKKLELNPSAFTGNSIRSSGTVSAYDFTGDGYLDLFIGDRMKPQLYGVPVSGHLFANDQKRAFIEVSDEVAPGLREIGMITDSEWFDADNDGDADLVIAGEWMPLKLYMNEGGRFSEFTESGFGASTGMHNVVKSVDMDGDGDLDLLVGNHGLNSRFRASEQAPIRIYVGDFDQNGGIEHITTSYQNGDYYPMVQLKDLIKQIPVMKKKFLRYEAYKNATIADILNSQQLESAIIHEVKDLETALFMNNGFGTFTKQALPVEAQVSTVFAIYADDFNGDGMMDFILAGNQHRAKPETGIYAASYGQLFIGNKEGGYSYVPPGESGISTAGEVRQILDFDSGNTLVFIKNNDKPYIVNKILK